MKKRSQFSILDKSADLADFYDPQILGALNFRRHKGHETTLMNRFEAEKNQGVASSMLYRSVKTRIPTRSY